MAISDEILIIQTRAAEMDSLIAQFRVARAAMDAAERQIRQLRPRTDPSKGQQERLSLVALDAMGKPSIAGEPTIAQRATATWVGVS